jgi:hypothetical protein
MIIIKEVRVYGTKETEVFEKNTPEQDHYLCGDHHPHYLAAQHQAGVRLYPVPDE